MAGANSKGDRFLTVAVIVVGLAGAVYFGLTAVRDDVRQSADNPFEYRLDRYRRSEARQAYLELTPIKLPLQQPYAIAVFGNWLAVSGDRTVLLFTLEGDPLTQWPTERPVSCLAFDEQGNLYLGHGESVQVRDPNGNVSAQWQDLGVDAVLTSIAVAKEQVFVADAGQKVVWRFDRQGNLLGKIDRRSASDDGQGFVIPSPYFDLALDEDGSLWVVNPGKHQFENYTLDGRLRTFWSRSSFALDGFSGCCNPSHIALLPDGSFVTSEKGLPRIKIHGLHGEFLALVAGPEKFDEAVVGIDLAVDENGRIYALDPLRKQVRRFEKKDKQHE